MGLRINKLTLIKLSISLGVSMLAGHAFAAGTASLDRLQQAVENEQYAVAWQTAQTLKANYEGEARFDYLYGLAALETGHLDYALLALKRAVANAPEQVRPRLELARTYLALNNKASATNEFKAALELPMPALVRTNVEQQLQALAKGEEPVNQGVWQAATSFALGYDSNVNLGVSNASINLPIFGEVTLDDASVKQDSPLSELGAQLSYQRVQNAEQAWFISTSLNSKQYPDALAYSTRDLSLNAGKVLITGNKRYQLGLNLQALNVRDNSYSRSQGLEASLNYKLAADKNWLSALTWSHTAYQQASNKSQNNQTLQLSQQYQLNYGDLGHQIGFAVSHEIPAENKFKYLSRDVLSLGYGLNKTWNTMQTSSIGVNAQRRVNQDNDLTYRAKRKDTRLTFQIAHQVQLTNKTTFFTNAGYVKNASNLDLYDSKKAFFKAGINHQF